VKNDVNVPSKSNKQKTSKKFKYFWALEGQWQKEQDPDPYQNGMDPEHC
jgi:hypothetical protein